jgi:hypothetical protein
MRHDLDLPGNSNRSQGLTRRTALRSSAWTVPAVVVATAAPAMAVSPGEPTVTVLVVPSQINATSSRYDITFNNAGSATSAFYYTLTATRTSATGSPIGLTIGAPYALGTVSGPPEAYTFEVVKTDQVLPNGLSTTFLEVEVDDAEYVATFGFTAFPTPGSGGSTVSAYPAPPTSPRAQPSARGTGQFVRVP